MSFDTNTVAQPASAAVALQTSPITPNRSRTKPSRVSKPLNHTTGAVYEPSKHKLVEMVKEALREDHATYFHEAGHAVIGDLLGFRPLRIDGPLCVHDRRTSSFFRVRHGLLQSPKARERASEYAISLVAGIAAESKATGKEFKTLRDTSGEDDYEKIHYIIERLMLRNVYLDSPDVRQNVVDLWEAKARAMLEQPRVWAAVESVVVYLYEGLGVLGAVDIAHAIREGQQRDHVSLNHRKRRNGTF